MSTCNHRLWVDGCFDLTHFGHFNALRQAHHLLPKQPDAQLVVGVHSDTAVLINKGPPVMLEEERYEMVRQCKWTGQVAEDAPYNTTLETLDKWDCGYCAHGDDTTTMADGSDCYQAVKDAKRYKEYKRTMGVSTTDIVNRMLLGTPAKPLQEWPLLQEFAEPIIGTHKGNKVWRLENNALTEVIKGPAVSADDKVIYAAGDWDLFHVGHVELLKHAKELGSYLIVGLYTDADCLGRSNVLNIQERTLSVLACKYVDAVVINASRDLESMHQLLGKIDLICYGESVEEQVKEVAGLNFRKIVHDKSDMGLTSAKVLERIEKGRLIYEERLRKKQAKAKAEGVTYV